MQNIKVALTCIILLWTVTSQAQLFVKKSFKKGLASVKGRYFNGTGGKGFWSLEKLDSSGRTIEKSRYRGKMLTERITYQYNHKNDVVSQINTFDINHPHVTDTGSYEYVYQNDLIVFEKYISPGKDSTTYTLVNNAGDSVLTYLERSYHYLADRAMMHPISETYVLTYQNSLLTRMEITRRAGQKEIINFSYFANGNVKRRIVKRIPEPGEEIVYMGGPGGDDQSYRYSYDRYGRIKKSYIIVNDKSYKVASYRYTRE